MTISRVTQHPSLYRIVRTDFSSFFLLILPFVSWIMLGAIFYFGFFPDIRWGRDPLTNENMPGMFNVALIGTLICIPLLIWRVMIIWRTLTQGEEVSGKIVNIFFYRDRGRVEYIYEYENQEYHCSNAIIKMNRTKALQPGNEVMIMVNPKNPERAFLRDLYVVS